MKTARILIIEVGSLNAARVVPRDVVACLTEVDCETAELAVSYPALSDETRRLAEVFVTWRPELSLLFFCSEAVGPGLTEFFTVFHRYNRRLPIVAVCPNPESSIGLELRKEGVLEVVTVSAQLKEVVPRLLALHRSEDPDCIPVNQLRAALGLEHIIGESPVFVNSLNQIASIARYDVSVMILGETGTGKEVFARAIHYRSPRATKPFVPVNCGAIPVDLLENEFFGHESGAFTSANSSRRGVIKEADGGTLFLDEVDSLPALAQVKLLRFLQDGQFRPLGSATDCSANVRIIAASNVHFADSLASGRFRKDLYYRLNVL
jgi:two-component system response regulator GlrR